MVILELIHAQRGRLVSARSSAFIRLRPMVRRKAHLFNGDSE